MDLNRLKSSQIFQGGMGVAISNWNLARTVSLLGQVGIVSGTGLAIVISRRLQNGDKDGMIRQALEHFPIPKMGRMIWDQYFVEGGKDPKKPFKSIPMPSHEPSYVSQALLIFSNFVEVWLAKRGHNGLIGVNYLEKLQAPRLPEMFGAILAGVDFVIAGAGLAIGFPDVLDRLMSFETATYNLGVVNDYGLNFAFPMQFNPASVMPKNDFQALGLSQPGCLGIVSTAAAANILDSKSGRRFDGWVVEGPRAGGHNASPRKSTELNERGEPIYDMDGKDNPGLDAIRELGLPYWLASEQCSPKALQAAPGLGANGVQIGTAFSICEESGHQLETKLQAIAEIKAGTYDVFTDPLASPSGYPFKVVLRSGTMGDESCYTKRNRICDLGYLRHAYADADGKIGWRCPAEPVEDYLRKGGKVGDTVDRKCICNGLMGTLGLGQVRKKSGYVEPPIITSGDDVAFLEHLPLGSNGLYGARDVIDYVLGATT
ncbi:MAG: nitronate monooxygenase [Patescibacteria group bacterium]